MAALPPSFLVRVEKLAHVVLHRLRRSFHALHHFLHARGAEPSQLDAGFLRLRAELRIVHRRVKALLQRSRALGGNFRWSKDRPSQRELREQKLKRGASVRVGRHFQRVRHILVGGVPRKTHLEYHLQMAVRELLGKLGVHCRYEDAARSLQFAALHCCRAYLRAAVVAGDRFELHAQHAVHAKREGLRIRAGARGADDHFTRLQVVG